MAKNLSPSSLYHIPLEKAITPADGEVLVNRYWVLHPIYGILIYQGFAPQCHSNIDLAGDLRKRLYPAYSLKRIETAYLGHRLSNGKYQNARKLPSE